MFAEPSRIRYNKYSTPAGSGPEKESWLDSHVGPSASIPPSGDESAHDLPVARAIDGQPPGVVAGDGRGLRGRIGSPTG